MLRLLDPKNDFVFKRLFADAPELLASLINAVRYREDPVRVVKVLNPRIDPQELNGKFIVLDVLAQDEHGQRYNIEMQVQPHRAWSARSTYYLARTLAQQLDNGDDYTDLKPAIGIHLLDFDLFGDPCEQDQAVWCFELRDRDRQDRRLGDALQLNIIELPKADRNGRFGIATTALQAWVTFLEHWQEEARMASIDYQPVKQALERIRLLSADDEARRLAFVRERALRDQRTELKVEREEGREEGLQIGNHRGLSKALLRLITRRFGAPDDKTLQRIESASSDQLEQWTDNFVDAGTLEDIFKGGSS